MPTIPFPDIPAYPGVPPIPRSGLASPLLAIGIGAVTSVLASALQKPSQWGIYDSSGNQLGVSSGSTSILQAIVSQVTGATGPVLSTYTFDYTKEVRASDFPVEGGKFANYNKVERPANPVVVLSLSGTQADRTKFLNALDAAVKSTNMYSVHTPEVTYINYTLERISLRRAADKGGNLLTVEVSLQEVRQVSAAFSQTGPIASPKDPGAASPVDSGKVQSISPTTSTLKSIASKLPSLF